MPRYLKIKRTDFVSPIEKENQKLKKELSQARSLADYLKYRVDELERQVEVMELNLDELRKENGKLEESIDRLQSNTVNVFELEEAAKNAKKRLEYSKHYGMHFADRILTGIGTGVVADD